MISRFSTGMRVVGAGLLAFAVVVLATPAQADGTATSATDERWLAAAHQSNLAEIAAGRDARRYAVDGDVRDMAEELVEDHTELDKTIVELARENDAFVLPTAPSREQQAALAQLQGKEGQAYDAAWVRSQIAAHRQAKADATREITGGESRDVRGAARDASPILQRHLEELTEISEDLGLSAPSEVAGGTGGQAAAAASRSLPAIVLAVVGAGLLGAAAVASRRGRRAGR